MQSDHRNSLLMWYSASLLLLLLVNPCAAQTTVPAEDPPRLVVDFRGPVGRTRALGFAGSDRRFFSAGENKRLQFYDVVNQSIVPGTVIRWEFASNNPVIRPGQLHGEFDAGGAGAGHRRARVAPSACARS